MIKYFLFSVLLITACSIDKEKKVDREKFTFTMGDDTELFFRNMRSSYYNKEEREGTRMTVYRHEDLYSDTSLYSIKIAIVLNPVKDEAFILLEPGEGFSDEDITIHWMDPERTESGEIILEGRNIVSMREFAAKLYEAIRENKSLIVKKKDEAVPILHEEDQREAFRITMSDYFRLVRVF